MSTSNCDSFEVAVIGAGVVGCATALALARRGVAVAVLEAEAEPGLAASGTNSGILHTGFDSAPGELETELILRSAALRDPVIAALGVPVLRCGAVMAVDDHGRRDQILATARANGVAIEAVGDRLLEVEGEAVTDPVAYTLALASAARRHGAELLMGFRVAAIDRATDRLILRSDGGRGAVRCRVAVNCAGLWADAVARLAGDCSFEIYPRKGEFLVFEPPAGEPLERIILAVPTTQTKGVLVFPSIDGAVIAGPTAVDLADKLDWSVRREACDEILLKARAMYPPLKDAEPIAAYAGLRPAGRARNYVIEPSLTCPRLVNVAAIRSTGLSASLAIAERVCALVDTLGVALGRERALEPGPAMASAGPWWRRTAEYRAA
jgi:glycerol-3-phosphate dehydrogenase